MELGGLIYFITPVTGWLCAQGAKFFLSLKDDGLSWSDLFASGGMPSSHSSLISSVTTVIGLSEGFDSAVFGLSLAFLGVVMYDAIGVRRATGMNSEAIKHLSKQAGVKNKINDDYLSHGHSPKEAAAGAALGIVVGIVVHTLIGA